MPDLTYTKIISHHFPALIAALFLIVTLVVIIGHFLNRNDQPCRAINRLSLRGRIEESKRYYTERYGDLTWQWYDEGLPFAIMDYHSSVGSLLDFTGDDFDAASENGLNREEIAVLCEEDEF